MISERGMKIAAGLLGITPDEYRAHVDAGEAWCSGHREWHPKADFSPSTYNRSGVSGNCRDWHAQYQRGGITTIYGARP